MDRRIDLVVALCFAALGVYILVAAGDIRQGMMRDPIGPRMAFYTVGAVLAGGGLFIAARHALAFARGAGITMAHEGTADDPGHRASALQAFLLVAVCLLYALAFRPVGYLLATPLFVFAGLAVLGERRWGINAVIALGFTAVSYIVFAQILSVRVPVGPLTPLFRDLGWIIL